MRTFVKKTVESIDEYLREQCLHWFGHKERMDRERPQSVTINFKIHCSKKRYTKEEMEGGNGCGHES